MVYTGAKIPYAEIHPMEIPHYLDDGHRLANAACGTLCMHRMKGLGAVSLDVVVQALLNLQYALHDVTGFFTY